MPDKKQIIAELNQANEAVWIAVIIRATRLTLENMDESKCQLDTVIWDILDKYPQEERAKYYKHLSRAWHSDRLKIPESFKKLQAPNKDELLTVPQLALNSYKNNNYTRPLITNNGSSVPADQAQSSFGNASETGIMDWILKKLHPLYSGYERYPEPWKSRMKSILVWESIITPIVLSLIVIGLVGFFVPDIVVLAFMSLALFSTLGELALRLILNINNNSDPVFQDYQSLNVVSFFKRFGRALSSRLTEDWPDGFPNKTKAALLRFCVLLAVPFVILGNIFNVVWIAITTPMLMAITISVNLIINLPLYCLDISQWVTQMMGFVPQKLSSNPLPTETSDMSPDSGSYASINEELRNNSSLVISGAEHRPPPVSATAMIRKESEAQKHLFVPSAGMFVQTRYVLRDAVNQPLALMNEALSIENGL